MSGPRTYRKRPVDVEAMQFDGTGQSTDAILRWAPLAPPPSADGSYLVSREDGLFNLLIATREGVMTASPGDFIVRGVQGEYYPVKPDIFAETYDEPQLAVSAPAEERPEPTSLFAPRVHALAAAILASPRALDAGGIEMRPTVDGNHLKLTLAAVLDADELRAVESADAATGRITHVPSPPAVCERSAGCLDKPNPWVHTRGTIWTCDECGRQWVLVTGAQYNEPYAAWRILTDANRDGHDR